MIGNRLSSYKVEGFMSFLRSIFFFSFISLFLCTQVLADPERPLIVVPGIVGSVLSDDSGDVVWGDLGSLNRSNFERLNLLPEDGKIEELKSTDIIRDVPLPFGLYKHGIYSNLIDFLSGNRSIFDKVTGRQIVGDYDEGKNLFVFPYDWRRTNFASAKRLNDFIMDKVPSGEYDIIAHSMGGIITRLMLDGRSPGGVCAGEQQNIAGLASISKEDRSTICNTMYGSPNETVWPTDEFDGPHAAAGRLHTYVEMAVPHFGSNSLVATLIGGWGSLSRILIGGQRTIQDILLAMPAPIELLPLYDGCCAYGKAGAAHGNQRIENIDEILQGKLWAEQVLGFKKTPCPYTHCDLRRRILEASLKNRKVIHEVMEHKLPDTIKGLFAVVGRYVEGTNQTFYLSNDVDGEGITFKTNNDGDGTVHRLSALPPEYPDVSVITAYQTSHPVIFDDDSVQQQIHGVILNPLDEIITAVAGGFWQFSNVTIVSSGLEIDPSIALPGEEITVTLAMVVASKDRTQLPDVVSDRTPTFRLEALDGSRGRALDDLVYNEDQSYPGRGEIFFQQKFVAPEDPGVHSVGVFDDDNDTLIKMDYIYVLDED